MTLGARPGCGDAATPLPMYAVEAVPQLTMFPARIQARTQTLNPI